MRIGIALAVLLVASSVARAQPPPDDVALYTRWCARCHGDRGDGRGPAAAALILNLQPPRDFTTGRFKIVSVRPGGAPTDADLAHTIAAGLPGTAMPYFADLLSAAEIQRLVAVVRGFGPARAIGTPIDPGPAIPDTPESRARGAKLYTDLGCPACHGDGGHGDGSSAAALRAADGTRIVPADLTRPWTFKGGGEPADVAMRLAAGLGGTPMPGYLDAASVADLWDVANHVRSLASAPDVRAAAIARAQLAPGAGEEPARRGEYVAKSGTCFLCHVQMNSDGSYTAGSFGAGGMRITVDPLATVYSRNLTPDVETGLGAWTAADLRRALRDGRSRDGRALNALDMPWTLLAGLTDGDVDALHAYFATLPPVKNLVPAPEPLGLWDGIVGKGLLLLRGGPVRAGFHPLNAGRAPADDERPAPVVNPARDLLVTLACAGLLLLYLVRRRRRRALETALVVLVLVAVPVVYTWPPLRYMPPALVRGDPPFDAVARAFALPPIRRPPPAVPIDDADVAALAERGRYVATIGTCSLCHTAGPSVTRLWAPYPEMGGGMRVAWRVFGTTWSRNLTPHAETGLGQWTPAQVKRAITAGIARDGRQMHWQAMPWDHFSNLTPEDLEALVAYLRHLPPADSAVPAPIPPAPGDPDADTFDFAYSGTYRP